MRRGSEAVEFALTLPLLLVMVSGIVDFGWYWWQEAALVEAVSDGARAGSVTPRATADPLERARATTLDRLEAQGVSFTPDVTASFVVDVTGEQAVRVEAGGAWAGLWNVVAAPYTLRAVATLRMEEQPPP